MNMDPILLVEDNVDDVALTKRAFKKNNIPNEVVVARDGVEAINYLLGSGDDAGAASRKPPAIILLDLNLPRLNGLEVLERIRADVRTGDARVIIITSSREERDIEQGYRLGANSYIRKPVDFDEFVTAAGRLGEYWLGLNEPPPKKFAA